MLMLTPNAAQAVRALTSGQDAEQQAGLRITTAADAENFQLAVASAPAENDEVLTAQGARIFLDATSAAFFDDKILDAGLDSTGKPTFAFEPQTDAE